MHGGTVGSGAPKGNQNAFRTGVHTREMIHRGHCVLLQPGATGEIRLVNQLFGLAA